jgi:general secretion pathway protein F
MKFSFLRPMFIAALAARRALRDPALKMRWDTWKLGAPVYGRFERSLNTSRFASTLAITISSGVPILRALQTSRDTLSNVALRAQVEAATASVREGVGLARALSAHPHFPPMLIHMIRAGEVTGELPTMLKSLAALYEDTARQRMKQHYGGTADGADDAHANPAQLAYLAYQHHRSCSRSPAGK